MKEYKLLKGALKLVIIVVFLYSAQNNAIIINQNVEEIDHSFGNITPKKRLLEPFPYLKEQLIYIDKLLTYVIYRLFGMN